LDRRQPFPADFRLFLASQSPRRHSLLREIGVPFVVLSSRAEEKVEGGSLRELAEHNAVAKLQAAFAAQAVPEGSFVLATDTLVGADGVVMGKPVSADEARRFLKRLSGCDHQVVSGLALIRTGPQAQPLVASAVTDVSFVAYSDEDIEAYVASLEWKGKAGAYAIQGLAAMFVSRIRGEYSNVVGLPLGFLARMFRQLGFDLLRRDWINEASAGPASG